MAMTSATNPSLEDIILQAIPGMPKVVVHNQVIDYQNGAGVHAGVVRRRGGQARPVRARHRGLARQRGDQRRRVLDRVRRQPRDRPADHDERVDRPARAEGGGRRRRRHLRHLRRHPGDEEQPDRRDGRARLPRLELEVEGRPAGRLHPRLPGPAGQHDRDAALPGAAPRRARARRRSSTRRCGRKWLFGRTVREGCNRAGFAEQGEFATEYGSDHRCLVKLGCKGPVVKCNVPVRGWVNGIGGCPNVGGICMACTMPGLPRQVHAVHGRRPLGRRGVQLQQVRVRPDRALRPQAQHQDQKYDKEPEWRRKGSAGSRPATQKRW